MPRTPVRNIWLLTVCQGLFVLSMSIDLTLTGLVGYRLAPTPALATLPFALITVATALTALFAAFVLSRLGRRLGFALGAAAGAAGGLTSVLAIVGAEFWLFCLGTALVGVARAFAQYYRLAAGDAARDGDKARAISTVLAGGVLAALIGPALAASSRTWLADSAFAGSYLVVTVLGLLSACLLMALYRDHDASDSHDHRQGTDAAPARRLSRIVRQPIFGAALGNTLVGSAAMMFVMTATPLAVVAHHFSIDQGAWVIEWHLLGMYVPSFFTGALIRRLGLAPVLLAGHLLCGACAVIAVNGDTLYHFVAALLCLGMGWNFMFAGGSTLLTLSYRPAERAGTQAAGEFTTYAATALASLLAGQALAALGWVLVNLAVLPFLVGSALLTLRWMFAPAVAGNTELASGTAGARQG